MTRESIEQQRQEIADQQDRMIGLFAALCIGLFSGTGMTLAFLIF